MKHSVINTISEQFFISRIFQFFHRVQPGVLGNPHHIVQPGFRNTVAVLRFDQILLGRGQFHFTAEQVHLGHHAHIILGLYVFQMVFQGRYGLLADLFVIDGCQQRVVGVGNGLFQLNKRQFLAQYTALVSCLGAFFGSDQATVINRYRQVHSAAVIISNLFA